MKRNELFPVQHENSRHVLRGNVSYTNPTFLEDKFKDPHACS